MRLVILESPYSAPRDHLVTRNIHYARACIKHALAEGDAPFASHLLYTQPGILNDRLIHEREKGISAGLAWLQVAEASVVYTDLGISEGMEIGIAAAQVARVPIEYRKLGRNWYRNWPEEIIT